MTWRVGLLLVSSSLVVACATTSIDDERLNLLARDRDFSNSVADMDKVLAFYAPDASIGLPEMPIATGVNNIRSAAQTFAAVPGFSIEWEPTQGSVSASGDLGFTSGTYRVTTSAPDKRPVMTGAYLEVWKKSNGEWKIMQHFFHPDPI